jgi:hypothetical protein
VAIYLSTTVRELHRNLEPGGEGDEEEDDADELDPNVLDGVYSTGERFDQMVKRGDGVMNHLSSNRLLTFK